MLGRKVLVMGRRWIRAVPWKGVAAVAVVTPVVAVAQGAVLLLDYRRNHIHAPCPDMPSRGLVVVRSSSATPDDNDDSSLSYDDNEYYDKESVRLLKGENEYKNENGVSEQIPEQPELSTSYQNCQASSREHDNTLSPRRPRHNDNETATTSSCALPPLRILVIGDSLAAGVGTRRSGTPVLPEAVAQALSRALDGRAVLWTCVGVPGQTASETVLDIEHLDDVLLATSPSNSSSSLLSSNLLRQWDEWQTLQRKRAAERIQSAKERTQAWIDYCKEQRLLQDERDAEMEAAQQPWWKRVSLQMRRDVNALRHIVLSKDEPLSNVDTAIVPAKPSVAATDDQKFDVVGSYDVAIVLTGCNDLKESYLPFMMKARRSAENAVRNSSQEAEAIESVPAEKGEGGIKGELLRILHALESKMIQRIIPDKVLLTDGSNRSASETADAVRFNKGPLIVFPAMPYEATTLGQRFPLSWFVSPLLHMIDRHKQLLSERYPDRVLYVPSPDSTTWSDFEAKRGPQWQDFNVLLKLNDIAVDAKERIEQLMQHHYARWVLDDDEIETSNTAHDIEFGDFLYRYEINDIEGMWMRTKKGDDRNGNRQSKRRNTLVAPDGIHPSDSGYDMWGRHIASAIVQEWDRQQHNVHNRHRNEQL